ncbi:hypothetical protein SAMN05216516_101586 [Izhakiella capsodis]|uniref:Uncharacterized protein n=1 Tax=Izhakiella capsodis TaxID=1367852 RepID=A0A1I4V6X1_9GAMM|nr:hypothetical protein SAMN05216516_101586 [Izhakiella capsodis]
MVALRFGIGCAESGSIRFIGVSNQRLAEETIGARRTAPSDSCMSACRSCYARPAKSQNKQLCLRGGEQSVCTLRKCRALSPGSGSL